MDIAAQESASKPYRNCYQLEERERTQLKKVTEDTAPKWWDKNNKPFDPENPKNWATIFKEYKYHCIYCRKDLTTSLEEVVSSTVDHLLPAWLFEPRSKANRKENLAPTCVLCNTLKGPWVPEIPKDPTDKESPWNNRKNYIAQARTHIEQVRSAKREDYGSFVGQGAINLKIWNDPDLD